jgi:hypothetical protein
MQPGLRVLAAAGAAFFGIKPRWYPTWVGVLREERYGHRYACL